MSSKIAEKNRISGRTQGIAIAILADAKRKKVCSGKGSDGSGCGCTLHCLFADIARRSHKKTSRMHLESLRLRLETGTRH